MTYAAETLFEEVAYVAFHFGWSREEILESTHAKALTGRMGEEKEIAAAVVFLCSEQAANVVGAAWSVDGGTVPLAI